MGGAPGFQIFGLGDLLQRLIDHLTNESSAKELALVINGDMDDFLAEASAVYFDPDQAVEKLKHIAEREAFAPVWLALQRFVRTPNRHLVVTLGNHDIELGLPW